MEHIAAFLLIVGCSPDLAECRELPAPEAVYETLEDCAQDLPPIAAKHEGAAPHLFVQCFDVDPLLTETDAEIVWEVNADGILSAWVEPYSESEVLVASTGGRDAAETVVNREDLIAARLPVKF